MLTYFFFEFFRLKFDLLNLEKKHNLKHCGAKDDAVFFSSFSRCIHVDNYQDGVRNFCVLTCSFLQLNTRGVPIFVAPRYVWPFFARPGSPRMAQCLLGMHRLPRC